MPGHRSQHRDNLLLIAATTILVLSAQRYFQASSPQEAKLATATALWQRRDGCQRERAASGQRRHASNPLAIPMGRLEGHSVVRPTSGPVKTACSPPPPVWCSSACLRYFRRSPTLVSCYGLFASPSTIGANLQTLALMLPEGSFQIVQDQIGRVLDKGNTALGATFLFGLALAIWSANAGVKAVIDALNVVYEEREKRSFVRLNLLSLAFTTGGIAALLLMVGAVVALPLAFDHLGLEPDSQTIVALARWPLLFIVLVAALGLLYRSDRAGGRRTGNG